MKKVKPMTPLVQLTNERMEINRESKVYEQKLKESWEYVHGHAGKLIWSEVTSMFHSGRNKSKNEKHDSFFSSSHMIPLAWGITKPMLIHWMMKMGWKGVKHLFKR